MIGITQNGFDYSAMAADAAMTFGTPADWTAWAHAFVVAPVVITSSINKQVFPERLFGERGFRSNA